MYDIYIFYLNLVSFTLVMTSVKRTNMSNSNAATKSHLELNGNSTGIMQSAEYLSHRKSYASDTSICNRNGTLTVTSIKQLEPSLKQVTRERTSNSATRATQLSTTYLHPSTVLNRSSTGNIYSYSLWKSLAVITATERVNHEEVISTTTKTKGLTTTKTAIQYIPKPLQSTLQLTVNKNIISTTNINFSNVFTSTAQSNDAIFAGSTIYLSPTRCTDLSSVSQIVKNTSSRKERTQIFQQLTLTQTNIALNVTSLFAIKSLTSQESCCQTATLSLPYPSVGRSNVELSSSSTLLPQQDTLNVMKNGTLRIAAISAAIPVVAFLLIVAIAVGIKRAAKSKRRLSTVRHMDECEIGLTQLKEELMLKKYAPTSDKVDSTG